MARNKKQQQIDCSQTLHAICEFNMLNIRETKLQVDITRGASKKQPVGKEHAVRKPHPPCRGKLLISPESEQDHFMIFACLFQQITATSLLCKGDALPERLTNAELKYILTLALSLI